jgi:predicted GNAT family N-acyltransferase
MLARHETAGPIATARFFTDGKIGRMAVLKEWRKQGIGRAMLEEIIKHATTSGRHRLHLSAQQSAIPFYEKSGFCCQGDPYYEAGILHQDMILDVIQNQ